MTSLEMVDIVDDNNNIVKTVSRKEMRQLQLPHRASYIALMNKEGRFLVEIRTLSKDYAPGLFDAVVGGVIQHGENVDDASKRELLEEVGVDANDENNTYYNLGVYKIESNSKMGFVYGYLNLCISDKITVAQQEEVSGVMFLKEDELKALKDYVVPDSMTAFNEIIKRAREKGLIS